MDGPSSEVGPLSLLLRTIVGFSRVVPPGVADLGKETLMLRSGYGLRAAAAVTAAAEFVTLAVIVWSLVRLDGCGAREGCLGYVLYFWVGCAAALLISIVGLAIFVMARRYRLPSRILLISITLPPGCVLSFFAASWLLR